jgi:hypothetical protein
LNPALKFDVKVSDSVVKPALSATYKDGKAVSWHTSAMTVQEISKDFWRHAKRLQEEEEVCWTWVDTTGDRLTGSR